MLQSALPEEMCVPSLYLLKIRHDNLGLQYSKEINHLVNLDTCIIWGVLPPKLYYIYLVLGESY